MRGFRLGEMPVHGARRLEGHVRRPSRAESAPTASSAQELRAPSGGAVPWYPLPPGDAVADAPAQLGTPHLGGC